MGAYDNNINEKQKKAEQCAANDAHLAKLTPEGYVCSLYGHCCKYQGRMTETFTNYFFCGKKSTAMKYQQMSSKKLEEIAENTS